MSLWTPGGEHNVSRDPAPPPTGGDPLPDPATSQAEGDPLADLSPEERERAEAMVGEMNEVRAQLASAPAVMVVANHAMGLYELAAIHLSQQPPNLPEAKVAVDAFGALVETLRGKLGEDEGTLTDALTQIRLAFVQLSAAVGQPGDTAGGAAGAPTS